jgi:hypothetical protein
MVFNFMPYSRIAAFVKSSEIPDATDPQLADTPMGLGQAGGR